MLLSYFATELMKIPVSTVTSSCTIFSDSDDSLILSMGFVGIVSGFLVVVFLFLFISLCIAFCKRHT